MHFAMVIIGNTGIDFIMNCNNLYYYKYILHGKICIDSERVLNHEMMIFY